MSFGALEQKKQTKMLEESVNNQIRYSLAMYFKNIKAASDLLYQSSELSSYLHSGESVKGYTENLLYARISVISTEFPFISNWSILDLNGKEVFNFKNSKIESANRYGFSFSLDRKYIVFRQKISFDDLYMGTTSAKHRGSIVAFVKMEDIFKMIPSLKEIPHLPRSGNISEIVLKSKVKPGNSYFHWILISMGFVLMLCILIGINMTHKRILKPILDLTEYVRKKGRIRNAVESKTHEIDGLKSTFDVYSEELKTSHRELLKRSNATAIAEQARQVAHDIRSPLSALRVFSQQVSELQSEKKNLLNSAIDRISGIANELSEKNDNDLGNKAEKPKTTVEQVSLVELLDMIVLEKSLQYSSYPDLKISVSNVDEMCYFSHIDANLFGRVISNLINNAVEATGFKGIVKISLKSRVKGFVCIQISDNGVGIPRNMLEKIFEKGISYNKKEGTGLGLYHARKVVKSFGGDIKLRSRLQKGTIVSVELPVSSPPSWTVDSIDLSEVTQIVIFDDDRSIHELWKQKLANISYQGEVIHFYTVSEFKVWLESSYIPSSRLKIISDYEIYSSKVTGLDLIEKYDLMRCSYLVTSHFKNKLIRQRSQSIGVPLIIKSLVWYINLYYRQPVTQKLI